MRVPEATVDKDYFPSRTKNEIWRPRQITPMQAVPEPHGVYKPSNRHLRTGI